MRTCEQGCNGCDECTDYEPRKAMMTDKTGPSDLYRSLTEPEGWRERDKAREAAFIDAIPDRGMDVAEWKELFRLRAKDRTMEIALAAKNKAETNELLALQESDELRASLAAVLRHWREFGPEHGFDECIERAAAWALGPNVNSRTPHV